MNDAPDPDQEPTAAPYMRLPMPLVAAGLFIFLVGLLGFGLYANRNLRPQGIVVPTPVEPAAPSATPAALAVAATPTPLPVVAAPTTAATPLILIIVTPTSSPPPTTAPSATSVRFTATVSPTPMPTVEPTLGAEVGKAYENFWRVTSQALLELDATHLSEVMDDEYLAVVTNRISELRSEGRAIKTHVILNYDVIQATSTSANVVDDFEDDSVYVKIGTEEALTEPTGDQMRVLYKMRNSSGVWKVVDSVTSE